MKKAAQPKADRPSRHGLKTIQAMTLAVNRLYAERAKLGLPVAIWRDGKVVSFIPDPPKDFHDPGPRYRIQP